MKEDFLNELKTISNYTYTENGAFAYKSTGNAVLDAFGLLGGMMQHDAAIILDTFYRAFSEDPKLAMKLLFYMRDIRGGQGLRRVFRIIVSSLAFTHTDLVVKNLDNFLEYGRGDDLLCLFDTPAEDAMINFVAQTLTSDLSNVVAGKPCTLLAKWMPSINTSSSTTRMFANRFCKALDMKPADYRILITTIRQHLNIVESKMSANEWDSIEYNLVPSKASMIYSDAFFKHAQEEYIKYLKDIANGNAKINAGALFPVDIIGKVMETQYNHTMKDEYLYQAMWEALPNYFGDTEETGICVVDTSGSMYGVPINVALSLGMYCADKCKGPFKNHFITFSGYPQLQEIKGDTIYNKVQSMERANWDMNTNLEAVFNLILNTAIQGSLKQEDLPSKLYIISDMQFDSCTTQDGGGRQITFIDEMRDRYNESGYDLPAIVFWNVRSSECGMFQQKVGDENCCMVSGYSSSLFKSVIEGTEYVEEINDAGEKVVKQKIDPLTVMLNTLNSERYSKVYVGE